MTDANRLHLSATLAGREALRFTPAGVPILSARLHHCSEQHEADSVRKVELEIAAVFAGRLAQRAERLALGKPLEVHGFIAPRRRQSKSWLLHVTEFESIEE